MAHHQSSSANQEGAGQDSEPPNSAEEIMDFSETNTLKEADKNWNIFLSWGKRPSSNRRLP